MVTKELSIYLTRKINIGNYESVDINIGQTVSVEASDDTDAVREDLFNHLTHFLQEKTELVDKNVRR